MKKLVFAMGCFAAILLTSSCTSDSIAEAKNVNLSTPHKTTVPTTTDIKAGGISDPTPPRG